MSTVIALIPWAILISVPLVLMYPLIRSTLALTWRTTRGEVIECYLEETEETGFSRSWIFNSIYTPKVEYRYSVHGREYISSHFAFGFWLKRIKFMARKIPEQYYRNESITVYYNPKNHGEAVLMTGVKWFHLLQIIFGIFWMTVFLIDIGFWY